ncbi:MAG: hypothetical protein ACTH31_00515 [Pseudoclavibacter sp.]
MTSTTTSDGVLDPDALTPVGDQPSSWRESADAIEYYTSRGWTDGLPVVPPTQELLEQALAHTSLDPDAILVRMQHLNRALTVREAAFNAVLAGCRPEYLPVVIAAWQALDDYGISRTALWQSTTGTAPFLVVNGPITERLGINSAGNVFGSGFQANATIGRAIRLATLNVFRLRPHLLDQATQGTPAKYTCCIAENEAANPWPSLREERGFAPDESTVAAMLTRGTVFLEARQTSHPEQLLFDIADSASRTGGVVLEDVSSICLVLSPEHAQMLHDGGWTKDDIRGFLSELSERDLAHLDLVGKGGHSRATRWRVPVEHSDAIEVDPSAREPLKVLATPGQIEIVVAGADNAGVSTIVETVRHFKNPTSLRAIEV